MGEALALAFKRGQDFNETVKRKRQEEHLQECAERRAQGARLESAMVTPPPCPGLDLAAGGVAAPAQFEIPAATPGVRVAAGRQAGEQMILGASVAVPGGCAGQEEAEHSAVARLRLAARPMLEKRSADSASVRLKSSTSHSLPSWAFHPLTGHLVAGQPVAAGHPKPGSPSTAFHALLAQARVSSEWAARMLAASELAALVIQPVAVGRGRRAASSQLRIHAPPPVLQRGMSQLLGCTALPLVGIHNRAACVATLLMLLNSSDAWSSRSTRSARASAS